MEGVNPTLTFLALILGLSGNARDDANDQIAEIDRHAGCPLPMIVSAPPEQDSWGGALWNDATGAATIAPEWVDTSDPDVDAERLLPLVDQESGAIPRRAVPTGTDLSLAADGLCASDN